MSGCRFCRHDRLLWFGCSNGLYPDLYESLKNARRFMSAARAFARHKPIIVLKAGRSEEGVEAAFLIPPPTGRQ